MKTDQEELRYTEATTLRSNLKRAKWNRETLTIGGGEFSAALVSDILEAYISDYTKQIKVSDHQKLANEVVHLKNENSELKDAISILKINLEEAMGKRDPLY